MLLERSVCVVIPAFDEAPRIRATLESVPGFVDRILVVDDASTDGTAEVVGSVRDPRIQVLTHRVNQGVGGAVATGYARALRDRYDVTVVIGGDDQMHPGDMEPLVRAVVEDGVDYAKGNRLLRLRGWVSMPPSRLVGTLALSVLTMAVTGYLTVFDSQCGYTAISRGALGRLRIEDLFPRYGYPNDLLASLARIGARVRDVPVRIRYGPGTSKMRVHRVVWPLLGVLWRGWTRRMRPTP